MGRLLCFQLLVYLMGIFQLLLELLHLLIVLLLQLLSLPEGSLLDVLDLFGNISFGRSHFPLLCLQVGPHPTKLRL